MRFEISWFPNNSDNCDRLTFPEGKYNRQEVIDWVIEVEKRRGLDKINQLKGALTK